MGCPSCELHVDYFKIFIWMGVCMYVCKWNPQRLEEGTDPLEMELQMVLSHHMSAGNPAWVLRWSSECSFLPSGPTLQGNFDNVYKEFARCFISSLDF